jgi:hypothetical protein
MAEVSQVSRRWDEARRPVVGEDRATLAVLYCVWVLTQHRLAWQRKVDDVQFQRLAQGTEGSTAFA